MSAVSQFQVPSSSLTLTLGPDLAILRPVEVPLRRFGVGRDGGYVGPDCSITDGALILSFGLSYEWSFENAIAASANNVRYIVFDPTVSVWSFFNDFLSSVREIFCFGTNDTLNQRIRASCHKALVFTSYIRDFVLKNNQHVRKRAKGDCSGCPKCMTIAEIFAQ